MTKVAMLICALVVCAGCGPSEKERNARSLTGGDPWRGRAELHSYGCDACHVIPGVRTAVATVGPPLTQVGVRMYLAGRIENTPQNMEHWVRHPREIDPDTAMPDTGVTVEDARDIAAYLYMLR